MRHTSPAITLSVRIAPRIRAQLERLTNATGRPKSFLAAEAIENYLAVQAWRVKAIKEAVKKADSKDAKFIGHDQVSAWLESWDSKNEKEMPK
jgi:predicted transcriptional regulator